jgi:hypothetical protein
MAATDARLSSWKERFQKAPLARKVVTGLEGRAEEIWRRAFDLLRKESPEYRNAVDDEFTSESKSHCGELLKAIIGIASGRLGGSDPFRFVRKHAGAEARRLLTLSGMYPPKNLAVAIIRPPLLNNGSHVDIEVASRSLVRLLHHALPSSVFGKLIGLRNGEIIVVANSDSGTCGHLLKHLSRDAFGQSATASVAAGVGLSLEKSAITQVPEAIAEARLALDFATPSRAIRRFADIDLAEFIIRRVDRAALRFVPQWLREAYSAGPENDLIRTIRAFAECSLNVKQTARRLGVHTNTVYFRLNQIKKRTGADPRTFAGTSLLLTSLRLLDSHGQTHDPPRQNGMMAGGR